MMRLSTTEEPDLADLFATDTESATAAEADLDWLDLSEDAALQRHRVVMTILLIPSQP
jgi:hypothetical protein